MSGIEHGEGLAHKPNELTDFFVQQGTARFTALAALDMSAVTPYT